MFSKLQRFVQPIRSMSTITIPNSKQPAHRLTMIPGPIEFSDDVLDAMSTPSQAHTSPDFIPVFQEVLQNTRKLFKSSNPTSQPIVISASGSLGWDIVGANFLNRGEKTLVFSTGFFSDRLADALSYYTETDVDVVKAPLGESVPLSEVEKALSAKSYDVVTITHVDTSSAVISDVEAIAKKIRSIQPEALVVVDAVCSAGVEDIQFDNWGLDYVLTASQKAVGVPAGLSISIASERAVKKAFAKKRPTSYYANLQKWIPIMQAYEHGKGAYYATPPIQLIHAYRVSLREILEQGLDNRFAKHAETSNKFKDNLESLGLKLVAKREFGANGLTAVYFPKSINGPDLLKKISEKGVTLSTGIYAGIATEYFRVGHMGVSAVGKDRHDVDIVFRLIKETLEELEK
ncbi:Alanine/glyoxylate aminotransferase 1 [Komagataella phaffii CBS 7435]|nr:GQ67_04768T0 [Komagataella phaffii]AOA69690.1 GQ68_04740T0 [Komagataella phaffii GS115]CAH2450950.1 Alanine/glyoxylate aminotransferase 1 [Komagataella phaffii CBS 7435]CCA40731.1 Alanine/glyoxylate aminotransferase 1 [Komagataella phaffii CBS 7435]